jgi:hypothetical protein
MDHTKAKITKLKEMYVTLYDMFEILMQKKQNRSPESPMHWALP